MNSYEKGILPTFTWDELGESAYQHETGQRIAKDLNISNEIDLDGESQIEKAGVCGELKRSGVDVDIEPFKPFYADGMPPESGQK